MTEQQPESISDEVADDEVSTAEASPGAFHFAEYIPLPSYGGVFRFMRLHMRLYKGAIKAPGYVAGGIRAKWWRKSFWSYFVWDSTEAMRSYTSSSPAREILAEMHAMAGPGACNAEWVTTDAPEWDDALAQLERPTRYIVPPMPTDLRG